VARPRPAPQATHTPTVCVVDPRAEDYHGWADSAGNRGVKLHWFACAEEALRFSYGSAVDLWIVAAELPGRSGFDLCSMLKARSTNTLVYLVTDEWTPAREQAAWSVRASMFGSKPGHEAWLEEWLAHRRRTTSTADCAVPCARFA
jgi:DNA-binding response OmpR family regulator